MGNGEYNNGNFVIGIVCGKLGDVDGVSLEVDKWIKILLDLGHEVVALAGKFVSPLESIPLSNQIEVEMLQFGSPEQEYYEQLVFPHLSRNPPHLSDEQKREIAVTLESEGNELANILFRWVQHKNIDVIIAENTNAMPMTLIGGMAVYNLATDRRMATIFHHHDFWWERSRFSQNHIETLLGRIMPPVDPGLEHVVISTYSAHILRSLKRVQPLVIPNCEDFDAPVVQDEYNSTFRADLGFSEDDILIVQPTRIVRRKRIEDALALVCRVGERYPEIRDRLKFIISLYQGDEPDQGYIGEIQAEADRGGIDLQMISDRVGAERCTDEHGNKMYTNRDVLVNADLVTYLPIWEGFGNALLEAVAAKVPVVVATYLVYKTDIKIMGFENIEILDNYDEDGRLKITDDVVDKVYQLLNDTELRQSMIETNFRVGAEHFGFPALRDALEELLDDYGDEIRASRRRIKKSKQAYSV